MGSQVTTLHRITGSRVELADRCLYWARPDVDVPARHSSTAALLGSATHEAIDAGSSTIPDAYLDDVLSDATGSSWSGGDENIDIIGERWGLTPSAREQLRELHDTWREWWESWLPPGATVAHEVPYAFDVVTWAARKLERPPGGLAGDELRRWLDARTLPTEVRVTIDAAVGLPDGRVIVVDWKTGRSPLARAAQNAQLATGALCVAREMGIESIGVMLVRIQPGYVAADEAELDELTLDARALSLAAHLRALPTAEPSPGSHCSRLYCPLLGTCEGPRALARSAPALAAALPVRVETEEQAAAVLASAKPMQAYLDALKASAVEWAVRHGGRVRMADGTTMVRTPQTRRSLDASRPGVLQVLARIGDVDALVKVRRSVSIGDVERAAAKSAPAGRTRVAVEARRAVVAGVLKDLESTGAVKVTTFEQWEAEGAALSALALEETS